MLTLRQTLNFIHFWIGSIKLTYQTHIYGPLSLAPARDIWISYWAIIPCHLSEIKQLSLPNTSIFLMLWHLMWSSKVQKCNWNKLRNLRIIFWSNFSFFFWILFYWAACGSLMLIGICYGSSQSASNHLSLNNWCRWEFSCITLVCQTPKHLLMNPHPPY